MASADAGEIPAKRMPIATARGGDREREPVPDTGSFINRVILRRRYSRIREPPVTRRPGRRSTSSRETTTDPYNVKMRRPRPDRADAG
jgi:hypothetical protein